MARELTENNYWVDNQHNLHQANLELNNKLAQISREKIQLEDRFNLLKTNFERLHAVLRAQQRARPVIANGAFTPMGPPQPAQPGQQQQERASITQRAVNQFFNQPR
jgi:hypothetical protein